MTEPARASADPDTNERTAEPPATLPVLVGASVGDRLYTLAITACALCIPLLLAGLIAEIGAAGWPALARFGVGFLFSSGWDPVREQFGIAPAIVGTLMTSVIGLVPWAGRP